MRALYDDTKRIHDGAWFSVYRASGVLGIKIVGLLDDEKNPVWRAHVDEIMAKDGWPRFMALDVRDAIPGASLPKRMASAAWGKHVLAHIEWGTICVAGDARTGLTVRAILRIAGMTNFHLRAQADAFTRDIDAMIAGTRPAP
jgi:hypothetical protein